MQASINYKYPKIAADMLVKFKESYSTGNQSIGIVTQLTKRYVHVCWLINDGVRMSCDNYHLTTQESRRNLEPVPVGVKITLVNR